MGTGASGDTITLFDGSTIVGTGMVGAGGNWSIATSALADGPHTLTATATDLAGNTSGASAALPVTIDTVAPPVPGSLALAPASDSGVAGDGITNINTPVITGTGIAGDTITLLDSPLDGSTPVTTVGTATVGADGTWSITTSALANGARTLMRPT